MTESLAPRRKVLVLAPPLESVGGVQNYTRTLFAALQDVLGHSCVRMIAVPGEPEARDDGSSALRPHVKLRFLASAFATAIAWSPDLIVCAHIGVAPAARLIQKFTRVPYWVVLYGIEVWGELPPAKHNALRAAQRLVSITLFTLDAAIARHSLRDPGALILPPTLPKGQLPSPKASGVVSDGSQQPVVLTVARLAASERYKGHDVMLEAWPLVLRRVHEAVRDSSRGRASWASLQRCASQVPSPPKSLLSAMIAVPFLRCLRGRSWMLARRAAKASALFSWRPWRTASPLWVRASALLPNLFALASMVCWWTLQALPGSRMH